MTNEELLSVAEIVERLSARFHEHEAKMVEHRAAFGARTEADAKIIAGLREERDGLLTQVQDMRAERERLRSENQIMRNDAEDGYAEAIKVLGDPIALSKERDALRAEVAALQERLRASIARGDFAQMEVAALMSQTSKHPVKVGEWVRRLVPSPACGVGTVAKVVHVDDDTSEIEYDVKRIDGQHGVWFAKNCEPCDPPTVKREPKVGDTVRLVRVPTLQEYPEAWDVEWGRMGDVAEVVREPSSFVRVHTDYEWPLSCIEVVTEATHDTEAGKAAAESAVKTDPVADEIKVGDLVEVFQASYPMTTIGDIGAGGIVVKIVPESAFECEHVQIDSNGKTRIPFAGMASIKDVRKVTT